MNPEQFILMMNELPDSVIESANLPHSLPERERMRAVSSVRNAAAEQDAGDLPAANAKAERISVPRWTVAAVLAACMLFAVGTGAFLLHSDRDDLTVQSSQAEPEVTGSITTAPTGTAKPVTTQRTDRTDITTTGQSQRRRLQLRMRSQNRRTLKQNPRNRPQRKRQHRRRPPCRRQPNPRLPRQNPKRQPPRQSPRQNRAHRTRSCR